MERTSASHCLLPTAGHLPLLAAHGLRVVIRTPLINKTHGVRERAPGCSVKQYLSALSLTAYAPVLST